MNTSLDKNQKARNLIASYLPSLGASLAGNLCFEKQSFVGSSSENFRPARILKVAILGTRLI